MLIYIALILCVFTVSTTAFPVTGRTVSVITWSNLLSNPYHPEDTPKSASDDSVSADNEKFEVSLRTERVSAEFTSTHKWIDDKRLMINDHLFDLNKK